MSWKLIGEDLVIGHTWLAEWGRSWPFSAQWESAPIWSGGSSRILMREETKRIVSSENQKTHNWIWLNIIFMNFTPTFILTKWWVKSIGDLREICQCVAQREAFVWHECSSWLLVSRVCARVVICVRWPPLRSADAAKYAKLSRLMTSMMGLTTRVWSCTGRERGRTGVTVETEQHCRGTTWVLSRRTEVRWLLSIRAHYTVSLMMTRQDSALINDRWITD